MGGIGLRPWEIERLDMDDIASYVQGFLHYRKEGYQVSMNAGRLSGFLAIAPYLKKVKKPEDVVRFEWDSDEVKEEKTGYAPHIMEQILAADEYDINKGLLKPGMPAYDDAIERLNKAGRWH